MKEMNLPSGMGKRIDAREKPNAARSGQQRTEMIMNLKRNWYFPISAMAFFCLNAVQTPGYFAGLFFAFMAAVAVSARIPSIAVYIAEKRRGLCTVSFLTALGICWGGQSSFYANWKFFPKLQALGAMLPIPLDAAGAVSVFGAAVSIVFVYVCLLAFWNEMIRIMDEQPVFSGIGRAGQIVYSVLITASLVLVVTSFARTEAFYGTDYVYDIIYTSDSPSLVKGNVYLVLTHPENDLRQPLFAVFAAPFTGLPYLIGRLLGASASVQAILINMVQVVMMFAANIMLAKMMKLTPVKRACFLLLASCTYTHLLFTLMMEQYITAYFWLIFCMYQISGGQRPDRIALWGAGGSLLTSMILLPFMSEKSPLRNFKGWLIDMIRYGLEFVMLMLAFCRFDIIFNFTAKLSFLRGFIDRGLTVADKLCQYTAFVRNCFAAPDAGAGTAVAGHISWQMYPVTDINWTGIAILLLVLVSAVLNREKKSSLLAAGWAAFSAVMLLWLGWGTMENGLILYALYFGWAFLVLLFQLAEWLESRINLAFLTPFLSIGCSAALAAVNLPAIAEMVDFAVTFFPA